MAEETDLNDPKNQAAAQTPIVENAGPGEPGHYTPPNPHAGVTHTRTNEIRTPQMVEKAEEIPDTRPASDKAGTGTGTSHDGSKLTDEEYEAHTVPELRELADQRGIDIKSDARKDEIIEALKKG